MRARSSKRSVKQKVEFRARRSLPCMSISRTPFELVAAHWAIDIAHEHRTCRGPLGHRYRAHVELVAAHWAIDIATPFELVVGHRYRARVSNLSRPTGPSI